MTRLNLFPAPIDGHWAKWSPWGECAACGSGNRKRTRDCTDPAPSFNGKACVGSNTNSEQCIIKHCGMGKNGLIDTRTNLHKFTCLLTPRATNNSY